MTAPGSRSFEADGDLLSEVGALHKDTKEDQKSFDKVKAPQKRRAVVRVKSAETRRLCVSTLADESHGAENTSGGREERGGAELCPKCSHRATLGLHMCDNKVWSSGLQVLPSCGCCSRRGGAAHTINFCRKCHNG